jgi:hypothetical protein
LSSLVFWKALVFRNLPVDCFICMGLDMYVLYTNTNTCTHVLLYAYVYSFAKCL